MRRRARVDATQAAIVKALRAAGCSVQSLASQGKGTPDLLVGRNGLNLLMEVKSPEAYRKDGTLSLSHRVTHERQAEWREKWRGRVAVVASVDEALAAVSA